jgi:hypothetical protein
MRSGEKLWILQSVKQQHPNSDAGGGVQATIALFERVTTFLEPPQLTVVIPSVLHSNSVFLEQTSADFLLRHCVQMPYCYCKR